VSPLGAIAVQVMKLVASWPRNPRRGQFCLDSPGSRSAVDPSRRIRAEADIVLGYSEPTHDWQKNINAEEEDRYWPAPDGSQHPAEGNEQPDVRREFGMNC
jgi:hypothetical protein